MDPADYQTLVSIYEKDTNDLTRQDLDSFDEIVFSRTQVNAEAGLHRLIGDTVSDRGENDYFTLRVMTLLHQKKVPREELRSNHGAELVLAYENLSSFNDTVLLKKGHVHSLCIICKF